MTRQEVFTKAYNAIIKQGKPSFEPPITVNGSVLKSGVCVYRGPNDTKCAVGHLISDDDIKTFQIENNLGACDLPRMLIDKLIEPKDSALDLDDRRLFLCKLQGCHDNAALEAASFGSEDFLDIFRANMQMFAENHDLVVPS